MFKITMNLKQFHDLDDRARASQKAIPIIVQRVASQEFRQMHRELAPQIPVKTGGIRRHFGFSVRRGRAALVTATLGFIRRTDQRTAIAANVRQHGSHVTPKKRGYLWIPLPGNRQADGSPVVEARDIFFDRKKYFVGNSRAGNLIAFRKNGGREITPLFVLRRAIQVPARPVPFVERVKANTGAIIQKIEKTIAAVLEAKQNTQL